MSIGGEFCHCIESALAQVAERKLPGANCCRVCQGSGCNDPRHPGILANPIAKRLQRAPYVLSGVRARRYARRHPAASSDGLYAHGLRRR